MSFSVPTVNHAVEQEFTIEKQYYIMYKTSSKLKIIVK